MAKSGHWRHALCLNLDKLSMHDFIVNYDWLKVAQSILKLTFLVFPSKVVDSFLDSVRL